MHVNGGANQTSSFIIFSCVYKSNNNKFGSMEIHIKKAFVSIKPFFIVQAHSKTFTYAILNFVTQAIGWWMMGFAWVFLNTKDGMELKKCQK